MIVTHRYQNVYNQDKHRHIYKTFIYRVLKLLLFRCSELLLVLFERAAPITWQLAELFLDINGHLNSSPIHIIETFLIFARFYLAKFAPKHEGVTAGGKNRKLT
jgi:hypothetical protein